MYRQFQYFGFDPDEDLARNADRSLERLLDLSPYGSVPVALLEKTANGFRCAIDLYTRHGPFVAESCQSSASQALTSVCRALHEKLARWSDARWRVQPAKSSRVEVNPPA